MYSLAVLNGVLELRWRGRRRRVVLHEGEDKGSGKLTSQICAECFLHSRILKILSPWLAICPEGTDFIEQKCIQSHKYAAEHGLPILKNVLLPKTKGFCACLQELGGSLNAGVDVASCTNQCKFENEKSDQEDLGKLCN
ncbi:1-acylglycerol-3-phosphate O-acyltransferase [Trifolium repens]|nr:1-acylglycerol-3-phosphate O-acyltransferase [Trifolium repens]